MHQKKRKLRQNDAFNELVTVSVMLGLGHSFFDKPIFRKWAEIYVPDWNPSWNRRRCASYIKKCSLDIKNHVFELFKSHETFLEHVDSLPPKYCRTRWDSVYEFIKHFLKKY